jgi:hypothetical protein
MEKIPSLYARDPETSLKYVGRTLHERCHWVLEEPHSVRATMKWDGTCVMLDRHGQWWARHQLRPGKTAPGIYVPVEFDPATGKSQGWIPAETSGYMRQLGNALDALEQFDHEELESGTYELIGEKVGSNPHAVVGNALMKHGGMHMGFVPLDYEGLRDWLWDQHRALGYLEGVVWHHADGRRAKIKRKDFPPLMSEAL